MRISSERRVQPHFDFVSLVIAGPPHAGGLPVDQGAQLAGDAVHTQTKVGSGFALDADVYGRLVRFDAGLDVHQTLDGVELGHHHGGDAL